MVCTFESSKSAADSDFGDCPVTPCGRARIERASAMPTIGVNFTQHIVTRLLSGTTALFETPNSCAEMAPAGHNPNQMGGTGFKDVRETAGDAAVTESGRLESGAAPTCLREREAKSSYGKVP